METFLCIDSIPNLLNFFDTTVAPRLLFYSYIPIVVFSIVFAITVLLNERFSQKSVLLAGIILSFVLWTIAILFQWTAVRSDIVHFSWQILPLFEIGIYIFSFSFAYSALYKKNQPLWLLVFWCIVIILISEMLPTQFNMSAFDILNCEAILGGGWNVIYIFEVLIILAIILLGVYKFVKEKSKGILYVAGGISLFLIIFFLSNYIGELTQRYEINLYGPIGMFIFFVFLSYSILRYKTFNLKLFSTYLFVIVSWFLIFSLMFVNDLRIIHVVIGITLVVLLYLGFRLIQAVRIEILHREELEKLSNQLKFANEKLKGLDKLKTEFLSLASHQLRSPLTAIKGYSSMLIEGSFGELGEKQSEPLHRIFESTNHLVKVVEDLLNVSKIEQGGLSFEMNQFDMKKAVTDIVADLSITAANNRLVMTYEDDDLAPYIVYGDMEKLRQVILNLIDNSIKYTKEGTIKIKLVQHTASRKVILTITDTGIGMSPETKTALFGKFARGEGAKVNSGGSGLGLYLAKQIVEAHKGTLSADSAGVGKGSTFALTLSIDKAL